jgi:hypothetical protein
VGGGCWLTGPRRARDGHEVQLDTYTAFAADDLLGEVVMKGMLTGLATRRHRAAGEPVDAQIEQQARLTSKSAVSRRFLAQNRQVAPGLAGPRPWRPEASPA